MLSASVIGAATDLESKDKPLNGDRSNCSSRDRPIAWAAHAVTIPQWRDAPREEIQSLFLIARPPLQKQSVAGAVWEARGPYANTLAR